MPRYSHWTEFETQEEFDQIMEKEYQERLKRYEEYVHKYQPTDVVKQYINDMLKADYYKALFSNLNQFAYTRNPKIYGQVERSSPTIGQPNNHRVQFRIG